MNLFSLILYGVINLVMVVYHLRRKETFYQFPFWAGAVALGWFSPVAVTTCLGDEHALLFMEKHTG